MNNFYASYIIKQNKELLAQITDVYKNIRDYDIDINSLLRLGEKRTSDDYIYINVKRMSRCNEIEVIIEKSLKALEKYR